MIRDAQKEGVLLKEREGTRLRRLIILAINSACCLHRRLASSESLLDGEQQLIFRTHLEYRIKEPLPSHGPKRDVSYVEKNSFSVEGYEN